MPRGAHASGLEPEALAGQVELMSAHVAKVQGCLEENLAQDFNEQPAAVNLLELARTPARVPQREVERVVGLDEVAQPVECRRDPNAFGEGPPICNLFVPDHETPAGSDRSSPPGGSRRQRRAHSMRSATSPRLTGPARLMTSPIALVVVLAEQHHRSLEVGVADLGRRDQETTVHRPLLASQPETP